MITMTTEYKYMIFRSTITLQKSKQIHKYMNKSVIK